MILHSKHSSERAKRSEIGWGRLHQLYPEKMSQMGTQNMLALHDDPAFRQRHAERMAKTNRECREAGKYDENYAKAGQRGKKYLIAHNKSEKGRERSRKIGLANRGRKRTDEVKKKMSVIAKQKAKQLCICEFCGKECKGPNGLNIHRHAKHNNHLVKSIRQLSITADVYCLTVEKYHNFALSAGVFVHNCGILFLQVPGLHAQDVVDWNKRAKWVTEVEQRISTGLGSNRPAKMKEFKQKDVDGILHYGVKHLNVHADLCERQYIDIPEDIDLQLIERAYSKVQPQLGSVGGGNHFIEMQVDRDDGSVWVMVHCGSRGYGWQTANHFFYEGAKIRGLPSNKRELSWLRADEPLGKQYWAHHNSAANFAIANRHIIVKGINDALECVFNVTGKTYYEISHNLVQEEALLLPDGTYKKGFVHRKGATRAFPAGHPDLVGTKWEQTGHPCLIPGSMYDGAAILFAKEDAHKSGFSVNHGSGRIKARGAAKRELNEYQDIVDNEMKEVKRTLGGVDITGIVGNTAKTPLDECAHVYKNLDEVLAVLEAENIAHVANRLYPVANIKGVE